MQHLLLHAGRKHSPWPIPRSALGRFLMTLEIQFKDLSLRFQMFVKSFTDKTVWVVWLCWLYIGNLSTCDSR